MDSGPRVRALARYVIVDPKGAPLASVAPFADPCTAMREARRLGVRSSVLRDDGDGNFVAISHQGPGGWSPRMKRGKAA